MPQDRPDLEELLETVREFLESRSLPALAGDLAFQTRVCTNILRIVLRELREGPALDRAEAARLRELLGLEGSLEEQNRHLAQAIRDGSLDAATETVKDHLRKSVAEKLRIVNPGYLED